MGPGATAVPSHFSSMCVLPGMLARTLKHRFWDVLFCGCKEKSFQKWPRKDEVLLDVFGNYHTFWRVGNFLSWFSGEIVNVGLRSAFLGLVCRSWCAKRGLGLLPNKCSTRVTCQEKKLEQNPQVHSRTKDIPIRSYTWFFSPWMWSKHNCSVSTPLPTRLLRHQWRTANRRCHVSRRGVVVDLGEKLR